MDHDVPEELYPIAVLMDELSNDDLQQRLNSISRISTIALALGPERTRKDLLAFLREEVIDDEDEVVVTLAEELANFVPLIGGSDHVYLLIPLLEVMARLEETVVRDKAVQAFISVINDVEDEQLPSFVSLIRNLSRCDWFCSRNSAAGLFSTVYPRVDDESKKHLRDLFAMLCEDDTPMVRRAAASKLGRWRLQDMPKDDYIKGFAEVVEPEHVAGTLVDLFIRLAQDEQDSVRLLAVESSIHICNALDSRQCEELVMPTLMNTCSCDKSWRVRYILADKFVQLQESLGPDVCTSELVTNFVKMLKDPEAEVRAAATNGIPAFCANLPENIRLETTLQYIIPCVKDLSEDQSQYVRSGLAAHIMKLAPVVGQQASLTYLVDLFLKLLGDDFPEVRLNIISTLSEICDVIGVAQLSENLIPAIVELAEDRQWRVRLAVIEYVPILAEKLGAAFFSESLSTLSMKWLCDCVHSIRKAATKNVTELTRICGLPWAKQHLIPQILQMSTHQNYLQRMTTLFATNALLPQLDQQTILEDILPTVKQMANDPVPNVRFNVAKTLGNIITALNTREATVLPILRQLEEDSDQDVRYFATQSLEFEPVAAQ